MKDSLLKADPQSNVFVIDWSSGAKPPYAQAITNIRLIGAYIGNLMFKLEVIYSVQAWQF